MSDTNRENDPMDEFLSTLGDEPQETKVLRVPEVIPTIQGDATNTESNAGPDGQTPLEGSDAEAYAALKAKRAERRRKKLMRRGIVIGVLLLRLIFVGLNMIGINQDLFYIIKGGIILFACALDMRKYLVKK